MKSLAVNTVSISHEGAVTEEAQGDYHIPSLRVSSLCLSGDVTATEMHERAECEGNMTSSDLSIMTQR